MDWETGGKFEITELARLARRRPVDTIEVGTPAGDGYLAAVTGGEAATLLVKALEQFPDAATWVVLKDIQQDTAYAPLVNSLLRVVLSRLDIGVSVVFNHRCHVFISSRGARTPLHADDCNGMLVQVTGYKEVAMYDMGRRYFSPRLARLRSRTSRVFALPLNHTCQRQRYIIRPGTGLTVPWNWPHEATTRADSQSVSVNLSFETPTTTRCALASATNDLLLHAGCSPRAIGINEQADAVKALIGSMISRAGLLGRLERKYRRGDEIVA